MDRQSLTATSTHERRLPILIEETWTMHQSSKLSSRTLNVFYV